MYQTLSVVFSTSLSRSWETNFSKNFWYNKIMGSGRGKQRRAHAAVVPFKYDLGSRCTNFPGDMDQLLNATVLYKEMDVPSMSSREFQVTVCLDRKDNCLAVVSASGLRGDPLYCEVHGKYS